MFRRKAKASEAATDTSPAPDTRPTGDSDDSASGRKPDRPNGPWDVGELDGSHASHEVARLDLGALRVRPMAGMKVQMQVDQATGRATSVLLVAEQAAVQLMVIAAAKSKPLWPETKRALQSDADRRGGTAQDGSGPWGPVLRMTIPASTPDGRQGLQPSVVLGIDGPRWMLRATMIGKAAIDQAQMNQMMGVVQNTVVVRGDAPMAPGEVLTLTPPARPASDGDQDEAG